MKAHADLQPWFLVLFGVVWIAAMTYVAIMFFTVVRIRRLTGEAEGPNDWLNVWYRPQPIKYLRWIYSSRHRDLGDPLVSRLVPIIRVLFAVLLPAMLAIFALAITASK